METEIMAMHMCAKFSCLKFE